jgi:hypothetical protein
MTEALKPLARSNPQAFTGRTFALNRLLVTPDEGPADVDGAVAVTAAGADERGDHAVDVAETEPTTDPQRSAADEFWSNY